MTTTEPDDTDLTGPDEALLVISSSTERDTSSDLVPFRLDDDEAVLYAHRPKKAKMLQVIRGVGSLDDLDDLAAADTLDALVPLILDKDSENYLRARWDDDDDELDLDCLEPIFKTLVGLWYGTPTGGRRESPSRPPRTGPRSTVRSRSRG